jgi:hypothetical protein
MPGNELEQEKKIKEDKNLEIKADDNKQHEIEDNIDKRREYPPEVIDADNLRQETLKFKEHWAQMIDRLEKLKGPKKMVAAKNYIENIETAIIQLNIELSSTKWELEKYIMYKKVGHFIESFKTNFSMSGENEKQEKEIRGRIASTIAGGSERFKEEDIPPVNIPAIVTFCARIAALQEKISLLIETKVLISGYEGSDDYRFAKFHIGKALENIESPYSSEPHFRNLISYCGNIGADISFIDQAMKYQKEKKYDEARKELQKLDEQITQLFNEQT